MNRVIKCPRCGYYGLMHDQSGYYCFDCDYRVSNEDYHWSVADQAYESWADHDYDRD